MEGLPLDLVQLILEWTVLPPHQLSEGRRRSKKDSQQGHLVQPPPGERLLQRHGLFGAVRSTPRPIPIPTEPKSLFAFKQQLQKHTRIRSLPNCVVVASVSRRWRAIVLDLVPFDVLSLLSLKRLVRVSLGIGLADQGALTLSQFDTFFHFLSSRPWRATVLDVAFPAFSPDGFNVLLSNILSAKLKYPSICCLDQSCSFPHDPSPSPCKHHTVPHNHHSPPPLHSLSLAFRGPEFFKQDAPPSPSTDPVWATVNAVLQHLCNHLESTPSTALSIKSLRIYIYPESKGRSPRRPDSARNGIRGPRISTVDSENDLEWTTASRLWSRVGKLCSKSLESLQVRIMGPLGDKGWILSDNGSSGSSVTTTTRRHVRVYEDETETTVFGLGSGSNSIGQAFSQQDWLDLEAFMRSPRQRHLLHLIPPTSLPPTFRQTYHRHRHNPSPSSPRPPPAPSRKQTK
ncbi:hypothetical protein BCR33DRAFT_480110 [Rhizoclosmatium globosum]|uniref:Uncharacterized protein n=1 Tax=Rhizoclosmatium globosum TaxID=329046 RepID=A0A1Y2BNH9_9FUNG|nr:hypothetical protein BCR33DRAFT_480110 [Rhizoclosmatium globosum]|eukprot:ORY36304.1 hypothetical protein BCR33DRAFT_480110 [Rhizoclosmatium globosum]